MLHVLISSADFFCLDHDHAVRCCGYDTIDVSAFPHEKGWLRVRGGCGGSSDADTFKSAASTVGSPHTRPIVIVF